jgi:hypothetical protein
MIVVSDACTINIMSVNDDSSIVIDDSRVMLQMVEPLTDDSRGTIYEHNMYIVQATGLVFAGKALTLLTTNRLIWKGLTVANILAYIARSSLMLLAKKIRLLYNFLRL